MVVRKEKLQGVELNRKICSVLTDSAGMIQTFCVEKPKLDALQVANIMSTVGKEIGDNVNFLRDNRASYPEKTAKEIEAIEEPILKVLSLMPENINYSRGWLKFNPIKMEIMRKTARDEALPEIEAFVRRFRTAYPFPDEDPAALAKRHKPPRSNFLPVLGGSIALSLLIQHLAKSIDNLGTVFMVIIFVHLWYKFIEPPL